MSAKIVTEETPDWNNKAIHPLSSWEWGEARKKLGTEVLRIGEFENNKLQDVFQMTFHPIPHTPYTVGYLPRSVVPSRDVLNLVKEESLKRKSVFTKIEPYVEADDVDSSLFFFAESQRSPHPLFPKWTQMLDVTPSEDDLLASFKSKTRYNINLAEKKGVKIVEKTDAEGYAMFEELYFQTTQRQEYKGHTRHYHKTIFETLKNDISHILIAMYEGEPLAAYHLFLFNDVLYYPYGGSSDKHRNVMASNLLMWEAIRLGKKLNAKKFDMWGSEGPDYDRSAGGWSGFTRFKEGYNTQFVEFVGSFDIVYNPMLYRLYGVADVVRKKF